MLLHFFNLTALIFLTTLDVSASAETTVLKAKKWQLKFEVNAEGNAINPIVGRYIYFDSIHRCEGSLKQMDISRNGELELLAGLESGACGRNCSLILTKDLTFFREVCGNRVPDKGEFIGSENVGALIKQLNDLAANEASVEMTVLKAKNWEFKFKANATDNAMNPIVGRYTYSDSRTRCQGSLTQAGLSSGGELELLAAFEAGSQACIPNCSVFLAKDLTSFREICSNRVVHKGELITPENVDPLSKQLNELAAVEASAETTVLKAEKWELQFKLNSNGNAINPFVGRFTHVIGKTRCEGLLKQTGFTPTGELMLLEVLQSGGCNTDCSIFVTNDLNNYREICRGKFLDTVTETVMEKGRFIAAAESSNTSPLRNYIAKEMALFTAARDAERKVELEEIGRKDRALSKTTSAPSKTVRVEEASELDPRKPATKEMKSVLAAAVESDSKTWTLNQFKPGSIRNATMRPNGNGMNVVHATYTFNGNQIGWAEAEFDGSGKIQCLQFEDNQKCKSITPLKPTPVAKRETESERQQRLSDIAIKARDFQGTPPLIVPGLPGVKFGQTRSEVIALAPNVHWRNDEKGLSYRAERYNGTDKPIVPDAIETRTALTFDEKDRILISAYSVYLFVSEKDREAFQKTVTSEFQQTAPYVATDFNGGLYCTPDDAVSIAMALGSLNGKPRVELTSSVDCSENKLIAPNINMVEPTLRTKRIGESTTQIERASCMQPSFGLKLKETPQVFVDRRSGEILGTAPATHSFDSVPTYTNFCRIDITLLCLATGEKITLEHGNFLERCAEFEVE